MTKDSQLKRRACDLANSLLDSNVGYLEKVLELWKIGNSLYGQCWDTEFHIFGVVESSTDHLPTEQVRQYCSSQMLEQSDKELAEIRSFYRQDVIRACREILAKHQSV